MTVLSKFCINFNIEYLSVDNLRRVFTSFDSNQSGRLEVQEVMGLLGAISTSQQVVENLMLLYGVSPEIGLTFEDFVAFFSDPAFV